MLLVKITPNFALIFSETAESEQYDESGMQQYKLQAIKLINFYVKL